MKQYPFFRITSCMVLVIILASCSSTSKTTGSIVRQAEADDMALRSLFIDAQTERMLGNYTEAETKLKKCLSMDPGNHAVLYDLAYIYDAKKNFSEARNYAQKAVNENPDNIWYQTLLAEIAVEQGDLDKAEDVYERILKSHPEQFDYYYELAMVRFRKGDYAKSIEALDEIEKNIGHSDELFQRKQMLYLELGETERAKKDIQAKIDANPRDARYYSMMSDIYRREGNEEKAKEYLEKVLEFDPDNGLVQLSMYEHYRSTGQSEKAMEAMNKAFDDKEIDLETKIDILLSYLDHVGSETDGINHAYSLSDVLVRDYGTEAKVHALRGEFYMREERFKDARDSFRTAVEIDPSRALVWNQLLSLDTEIGDDDALLTDSEEALELFPTIPFFYLLNGIAYTNKGDFENATEILEAGKELVIDDDVTLLEFYSALGQAYHDSGDHEQSDRSFDRALNIRADNVYVLNNYSYYLSIRGDKLDQAEEMAAKANELQPGMASFQDTYAWVLYRAGKFDQAKEWLEKAMDNGGNSSGTIIEHYGDVLFKLGQKDEAIRQWMKAKDMGDTSDLIDKKISDGTLYE